MAIINIRVKVKFRKHEFCLVQVSAALSDPTGRTFWMLRSACQPVICAQHSVWNGFCTQETPTGRSKRLILVGVVLVMRDIQWSMQCNFDGLTGNVDNHDLTWRASPRHRSGSLVKLWQSNFNWGHERRNCLRIFINPAKYYHLWLNEMVLRCCAIFCFCWRHHNCYTHFSYSKQASGSVW